MEANMHPYLPKARTTDLRIQELDRETLVFDLKTDRASCLNATATLVWKLADGTRTLSEIAQQMSQTLNAPVDPRLVRYALDQLSNKQLLEQAVPMATEYAKMDRRAFLTRAGVVGTAVALPVIISILAPTPAHAQSGGCIIVDGKCISP